jgi:predicted DNA-binding protein
MCCMEDRSTHLSTWISADLKRRFAAAAAHQGLSQSALLRRLVERSLALTEDFSLVQQPPSVSRNARVTVRLVPDDSLLLRERAASRGMPAASYVSTLVRAHLRSLAPLPERELDALRSAVAQLAAMGRNLNVMARAASTAGVTTGPGREHVQLLLKICEGMRAHVKDVIKANVSSWESGHAQGSH